MSGPVEALAGERDARTIYDIACIREEKHGASREDVEFKAIALRNYQFCAAVAELIEAADKALAFVGYDGTGAEKVKEELRAALTNVGGAK